MISAVIRAGWLNLRRDRAAFILSFVVPVVFFSIFAGIFGARRSHTEKTTMAVADEDQSDNSRKLIAALRAEPALRLVESPKDGPTFNARSAEEFVRAGSAPVALVIPKGYGVTQVHFDGGDNPNMPQFHLLADSADPLADQIAAGLLQKTAMLSAGERTMAGLHPPRAAGATPSTPRFVKITRTDVVGQNKTNPFAAFYAAGIGVMFLLFTATNAGGALLEENESGTLDRILTTRLTFTQLLFGKLAYLWSLGFVQLCVMFVWGAIVFRVDLRHHLGGFVIMGLATSLACSAFGLLMASACRTRAQLSAVTTLAVLTISAIGGSMFPRFLMPEGLQKAGLVLFNSWAIEGFTNVFWREEPLSTIVLPVLVLLGWSIVFFATARQLTKRWEVG